MRRGKGKESGRRTRRGKGVEGKGGDLPDQCQTAYYALASCASDSAFADHCVRLQITFTYLTHLLVAQQHNNKNHRVTAIIQVNPTCVSRHLQLRTGEFCR